ncbi:enolase C-terminal domain-like protein [Burkholderia sp. Ac-20353]|uniref:enolase C-terminal domain-like protein n=1 Tax=Burkholderia sp. Ac-20353 TaxID=2703894 RepID=UPI00197BA714|nr:enolase C-terminal domain-like protein [Burkholderia sp. Ac-20353]MBN3787666.1 hypothetical protein [Burkholderia sp. Ac-20353]
MTQTSSFSIARVRVHRLDIPLRQPISMSFGVVDKQNVVLLTLIDRDGVEGHGEAVALGGPFWGSESAEGIYAAVERYIAPGLLDVTLGGIEDVSRRLDMSVRGNAAAKSAFEMAAIDLIARQACVPASTLLGGLCHRELPVAWTLSTGSAESDIEEGERALARHGHTRFKVKLAKTRIADDVKRVTKIVDTFAGRASVIADVNQGWDELTALRYLPVLQEAGLEAIEQPLPSSDLAAIARVKSKLHIDVIADEALVHIRSALSLIACGGASAFALKPNRDGGLLATKRLANLAYAAGVRLYGGTALETSLGTAALAHLYGGMPELHLGTELFGPMRLGCDLVTTPFEVRNGSIRVPDGHGFGVVPSNEIVRELSIVSAEINS